MPKPPSYKKTVLVTLLIIGSLVGCSTPETVDSLSAEKAFQEGERLQKNGRYEEAISKFQEVKNKFPYSHLATQAELKIGDVYFERESFVESASAYQVFKDLHPKHPRSDYVTYQLAKSYMEQLPGSIDRDLSVGNKSIHYFDELFQNYPSSEYIVSGQKDKDRVRKMLAEKEFYIAHFYYIRDMFDSALTRYEGLIASYPESGVIEKALLEAAKSAAELGEQEKARKYYRDLLETHPRSKGASEAKKQLSK